VRALGLLIVAALANDCEAGWFDFLKPKPPAELPALVLNQPSPPDVPPPGSVIHLESERMLPALFRTSDESGRVAVGSAFSRIGLDRLMASASGQFDREQLYSLQLALRGRDVHVMNLRAEPHGIVNRSAITWATDQEFRSVSGVQSAESRWLRQLMLQRTVDVVFYAKGGFSDPASWVPVTGLVFDVRTIATPAYMIAEARFTNHRLLFADGRLPDDSVVDDFVRLMKKLPDGAWRHFHCDTGGYRTSVCFVMWDMMQNFTSLNAVDIVARQRAMGGADLSKTPEVREFLNRFYSYCLAAGPDFKVKWSAWSRSND